MTGALPAATLLVVGLTLSPLFIATGTQASCEPASGPGVSVASLDEQQLTNAATVTGVAIDRGLGRDGAVIGVMTALTESSLHNVAHGDAAGPDSRGLFQQRSGWGPVEVRMRPAGAAALFYDVLVTVPGWTTMPPWQAAQAVQRSAFEDGSNYRANHDLAASLVDELLVGSPKSPTGRAVEGCGPAPIHDTGEALPGSAQAVRRAHRLVGGTGYYQLCARLAANIWGRSRAGYASAADQWAAMVETGHARPRDTRPPVGALLFWDTGNVHGHVAVYVGAGDVVSNDIGDETPGTGGVYLVSTADISSGWDATYLGWSAPVYP